VAAPWRDRVRSPTVSWREGEGFPDSLEFTGVTDPTAWLAAPVGAYVLRTLGLEQVRRHNATLAAYGQSVVGAALGLTPTDLPGPPTGGVTHPPAGGVAHPPTSGVTPLPMRVVPLPAGIGATVDGAAMLRRRIADELQTEVAINTWRGRGLLRLSANVYNRSDEYDRLADRLPSFLKSL
jgi:isopenicillin-N epimerase